MEQLEIIFKKNEEIHGYEYKITKGIKDKKECHCLDNRDNDVHGFYIEVFNGECN